MEYSVQPHASGLRTEWYHEQAQFYVFAHVICLFMVFLKRRRRKSWGFSTYEIWPPFIKICLTDRRCDTSIVAKPDGVLSITFCCREELMWRVVGWDQMFRMNPNEWIFLWTRALDKCYPQCILESSYLVHHLPLITIISILAVDHKVNLNKYEMV